MQDLGYELITKKVWIKPKIDIKLGERNNLYRYDYAMVQNFGRGKIKSRGTKRYRADNWTEDYKSEVFEGVRYTYHFPEKMITRCICNFTHKGDTVYDPFIGIGTTAIASYNIGRNYYGSEKDKEIFNIAKKRTENLKNISNIA